MHLTKRTSWWLQWVFDAIGAERDGRVSSAKLLAALRKSCQLRTLLMASVPHSITADQPP
jgi:hypothetical protein